MDRMIVAVFDSEPRAYEGLRALAELHGAGSLTVYSDAVIAKDANGTIALRQTASVGPVGAGIGAATGTLIGLLAGPAGTAVGMAAGTLGGVAHDIANLGFGADFVEEVSRDLTPGKSAVVAEVEEGWIAPLNARMGSIGGIVYRRSRSDVIDFQNERDAATLRREMSELQNELAQAKGDAKEAITSAIGSTRVALEAAEGRARARVDAMNRTADSKLQALQAQAARSKGEARTRIEQQIADIKSDRDMRTTKLHQAWQLTKEAFGLSSRPGAG